VALEVRTRKVVGKTAPRNTSADFVDFLGEVGAVPKWAVILVKFIRDRLDLSRAEGTSLAA